MHTPIFWAEGHPGPLSAEGWQVQLGGLIENPVTLSYEEILALPKSIADVRLTSVTRWSVRGKWGGVRISDLLSVVGIKPQATHIQFISYRNEKSSTIINSNKSFGDWQELFADPVITTGILDRMLHHCKVVNIKRNSYRLRGHRQHIQHEGSDEITIQQKISDGSKA